MIAQLSAVDVVVCHMLPFYQGGQSSFPKNIPLIECSIVLYLQVCHRSVCIPHDEGNVVSKL